MFTVHVKLSSLSFNGLQHEDNLLQDSTNIRKHTMRHIALCERQMQIRKNKQTK